MTTNSELDKSCLLKMLSYSLVICKGLGHQQGLLPEHTERPFVKTGDRLPTGARSSWKTSHFLCVATWYLSYSPSVAQLIPRVPADRRLTDSYSATVHSTATPTVSPGTRPYHCRRGRDGFFAGAEKQFSFDSQSTGIHQVQKHSIWY